MNRNLAEERWREVHHLILNAKRIVCSTHVGPDGDGLGSQLAFYHLLKAQKKDCRILNPSPLPEVYRFLSQLAHFEQYDGMYHTSWLRQADLAIIFDSGDYRRLRLLGEDLKKFNIPTLSIDHHPHLNPSGFSYALHDVSACATGYLVYEYIKYAEKHVGSGNGLSIEIAKGLYLAIMTDTGSFRFNNTSAEAHEMAGELIRFGIKPYDVYQQVYESTPVERIHLMAAALKTVHIDGDGQLALFMVTRKMIKEAGAKLEYVTGFTDLVRSIRGVEVAVMFHEIADDRCRVNFRSKGRIQIDELARRLGGGGHPFAAGVTVEKPLEQAMEYVVSAIRQEIKVQLKKAAIE